jgi:hypothetical protein
MSDEPLERADQAIKEGREAAEAATIMPFEGSGEGPGEGRGTSSDGPGEDPEETGGDVAQHGKDEE